MNFFTEIPEGQAIIHSRGVYRQAALFERDGSIHAKHGGGYVRLSQGGSCSAPTVRWSEIDVPNGAWKEVGHLVKYTPNAGEIAVAAE